MTESPDEYGELLRRALNAEANSVVPSPDGLEIIRARIERRGLRGLRGLVWWRVGASVTGAVLVAATVVMMVPQLREQVIQEVYSGEVNFTQSTAPDMSATSRPPSNNDNRVPAVPRTSSPPPPPEPTTERSRSAAPNTKATPTPRATPTPKPTPSDGCPTAPGDVTEECPPTPTAAPEPTGETESPCPPAGCSQPDEQQPPTPSEGMPTPVSH
ncbi:hypothetical protein AB0D67_00770 [Streptosporangium sp. NPDC048047]|uniref:hypothetical protein n=1 Tax=Streptosporangium sp. NPDC048047 TaxID=3155748 RepID=UPI003425AEE7